MRAVGADLEGRERRPQVVDGARERGEMEDVVDGLVEPDRLDHVVVDERERVVALVGDVLQRPGLEVVDADDPMPLLEQVIAEVRPEETGAAGDN